jgi:hypothetical protein
MSFPSSESSQSSESPNSFDIPVVDSFETFSAQIDSYIDPLFLNAHHLPSCLHHYVREPRFRQCFKLQIAFYIFSLISPHKDKSLTTGFLHPDLKHISALFVHSSVIYAQERYLFDTGYPAPFSVSILEER